jgi:DNA polymerase-3 subunit alpha
MASRFVHLHTHSHYTFLQALPKAEELIEKAKTEGMDAIALTDGGNLHGAIDFYMAGKKAGVKPIIGLDAYLAPRTRFDKDRALDAKRSRIILLAQNNEGYTNLLEIVTRSWTEGFFDRPRIDKELLREKGANLIAILPSFASDVSQLLRALDGAGARAALEEFASLFPPDEGGPRLYLEITHHPKVPGHEALMQDIIALARETGTPLVAQHDVYYLEPSDREPTEVMRRIQLGERLKANEEEDFSFISEARALELFADTPDAVDNSRAIANRCAITLTLGKFIFPVFKLPEGTTADEELRRLCEAGLAKRGLAGDKAVVERLDYELGIIAFKGYAAYFLVVEDLIRFARENGILYNIRGSVAGSMTTYLLSITKLNPLEYNIPFERFLNPDRPSAPDIDMDFADNRRDDVISYAKRKYGEDHVAQIGTFGTMMARAAVRDVARALGHSYATGDRIAKLIPMGSQGFPMTIDKALELEPELKSAYNEDDDVREVINVAKRIEGKVRHVGVHAAGVVIAPEPISHYTPTQFDPKGGKIITQYDMYAVGEDGVGLTKFDFLGIRNLTILGLAVDLIRKHRGVEIELENIPLDDPNTYAMLARGETVGLFQLSGTGMTKWLMELKPSSIHDINAMVALYRPGPMQFIPDFIARKHGTVAIRYLDKALEPILKQTYGILVYQDDLLIMAHDLAGYTWGEVDKFRKAVGKKIPEEMAKQKEKFIEGCVAHTGWSREKATNIWSWIEPFAAYGFNKAHSASYGRVAYQTAYLKANFPAEYMTAVLTAESGDTEKVAEIVAETKRMHIPVLPPDINESGAAFTVVGERNDAIRFGLSSIKNFGEGIANAILDERIARGPYASLSDFLSRVGSKNLNRKSLESLIKCGALDTLASRGALLKSIEPLLVYHREATAPAPQDSLFGAALAVPDFVLPPADPVGLAERLAWEKELLGMYVSGHPLDGHKDRTAKATLTIAAMKADPQPGRLVILPALIQEARTILTKSGEKMTFLKIEDTSDAIEAVVFPKLFKEHAALLAAGTCVLIKGKITNRNGEISLAIEDVKGI